MNDYVENTPVDEVLQDEEVPLKSLEVHTTRPVRTQDLPSKSAGYTTYGAVTTRGIRVLTADPRRKTAYIIAKDANFYVGGNQSQAGANGVWWPSVVPLVVGHRDEVWVAAVSTSTDISVYSEQWAE